VQDLLSTRIKVFRPPTNATSAQIANYFAHLPELRLVTDNPFNFQVFDSPVADRKMSINELIGLRDVELRGILNRIVRVNSSKFWYIRGVGENLVMLDFQ